MINQLYNEEVNKAFKKSLKERPLTVPKHYVTAKHAIRHTAVIHLVDYITNKDLDVGSDFLIASYIADEEYAVNTNYSPKVQEYARWINTIRMSNYEDTVKLFKQLTIDELIASLIHLWIDLLFLDYNSENEETYEFIKEKKMYTRRVLKEVHLKIEANTVDKAYLTIMDVLWTELHIARGRLDQSKGEDKDECY